MSVTSLLIPTYSQMLKALSGWLDKGEAHTDDAAGLLSARLADDMFPLATQVRFCCLQAHEAVARLKGEPLPDICQELAEEGRNAADRPGTIDGAQARIEATSAFLESLSASELDPGAERQLTIELPNGMVFDMTGAQYARDWALPQFYFHLMTAYGVLRAAGVPLGKADYVGHAFQYIRPETMPAGGQ